MVAKRGKTTLTLHGHLPKITQFSEDTQTLHPSIQSLSHYKSQLFTPYPLFLTGTQPGG